MSVLRVSFQGLSCPQPSAIICGGCGDTLAESRIWVAGLAAYDDPALVLLWLDDAEASADVSHVCSPQPGAPHAVVVMRQAELNAMRATITRLNAP